jgi:sugar/nucleoside kinase (ribokinase family)
VTIVVVGDLMADVVAKHDAPLAHASDTPARTRLQGGGAGGNVAAWLAYAGAEVALVGRVGDDPLAEVALAGLQGADRRVVRAAGERTGVCVVLVGPGGERTMLPDPGANAALAAADLPDDLFAAGNVLYLSGYTLLRESSRAAALAALARARAREMRIALDPASVAPLKSAPEFAAWAGAVDLLIANADEAAVLGDGHAAREVVVKRGAGGATWTDGARTAEVAAGHADVLDTTGAGDAFAAGFLSAWPGPPERALERGAELAARAVARLGARPA